ncbi:hypothetical protein LSTR_LSTR000656 [Laodelphax striatellus]|uniref:Succinate dehydrogenase assembly factor 4, mitochondrial n=1 Tax=Laodelphax striatellus TaxID=195883 RepID=A0A482XG51_LAOST|nr:hypothetical protein LSTR_LSTR000656 [Laodelphax striatellus]
MNLLRLQSLLKFNVPFRGLTVRFYSEKPAPTETTTADTSSAACSKVEKMAMKLRAKTPIGKLDELDVGKHPYQEKEPLQPYPEGVNPKTGEVGGPKGPEPTRYGDWERKGRVSDF